jgi:3-oxoacyl-[acyl-carrier protein] reductase
MDKMLKDRIAIVTGSGRGIGRATAMLFAQEGAKVVVSDIDTAPAEETVADIKKAGGDAVAYVGDATAAGFAEGIVKTALDSWGGLHIIVNNAGYTWDGMVHKMDDKQWDAMLNLHLKAPFQILRAAAPYIRETAKKEMDEGKSIARKIINVSSQVGLMGNAGQANYSAAKAGVLGLTMSIAKEWGRFNVQANVLAFGWVETRLTASKEKNADKIVREGKDIAIGVPEAQRNILKMTIPMGRPGTPEEAASVMLFLASPLSNYVSGQTILMSGGG